MNDMKNSQFSLSQVYAIHLYHLGDYTGPFLPNLDSYSWLSNSQSPAAHAFQAALPSWFNETYHNKNHCIDPPQLSQLWLVNYTYISVRN